MKSAPVAGEVGGRLQMLRFALGHEKQTAMVNWLGGSITSQHWNNWERGRNIPTIGQARFIAMKARVTVDWIYWGDRSGLPLGMVELLDQAERRAIHA